MAKSNKNKKQDKPPVSPGNRGETVSESQAEREGGSAVPAKAIVAAATADAHHAHVGHIVPFYVLAATFGGLLVLTVVTVGASYFDFGKLNLWVALLIAGLKASLVVYFFMHLRWDRPLNSVIFLSALAFVLLFIGFALTDTEEYQPDIRAYDSAQP
jgi:cytochrome c oxidase subunit 4